MGGSLGDEICLFKAVYMGHSYLDFHEISWKHFDGKGNGEYFESTNTENIRLGKK